MLQSMGSQRVRHKWATELNDSSVTQSCPTLRNPIPPRVETEDDSLGLLEGKAFLCPLP